MIKSELATMILDVGHRPDLTTKTDMFIRQAEQMVERDVRAIEQVIWGATLVNANRTGVGLSTYTLPVDFLAERVFWNPDTTRARPLASKSLGELRSLNASAPVLYYAVRGLVVEFRGNPADTDVIPFDYFASMPVLSATPGANILLDAHEELYLAAALFFLKRYVEDFDAAQGYLDSFNHATLKVNEAAMFKLGSQSAAPAPYNFNVQGSY
jgi:hypothetical protein